MAFLYAYVHYLDVSETAGNASFFFLLVQICVKRYVFYFLVKNLLLHDANTFLLKVDTYLMLLTTSSDAFYHLKDCR